jgi:hypothetical protein
MARRPGGRIEEELTRSVIGAFFDVYNTLGYGFLEQAPTTRPGPPTHLNTEVTGATEATTAPQDRSCHR